MILLLTGLLLAGATRPLEAFQADPSDVGGAPGTTGWHAGAELGRVPALRLGLETIEGGWLLGADAGLGPGRGDVAARLTPMLRLGRELGRGVRVAAGLGFEVAWLEGARSQDESEIQWELTGGWVGSRGFRAEAGVRRTDYREASWESLLRIAFGRQARGSPPRSVPAPPPSTYEPGLPPSAVDRGRLDLTVGALERAGSGVLAEASNPRGDPDPWSAAVGPNVDRLGGRAEAWMERGALRGWVRWRSDLHTDTSIVSRIRPIAEGGLFPVSVSIAAGGAWAAADGDARVSLAVRHDPRMFLWMPHLGEERTGRMWALEAEGSSRGGTLLVRHGALGTIDGQAVDPLDHTLLRAESRGPWRVGLEHELLTYDGPTPRLRASRTRATVARDGRISVRLGGGDDLVVRIGARTSSAVDDLRRSPAAVRPLHAGRTVPVASRPDHEAPARPPGFHARAEVEIRSSPDLLDYESLLGRGWGVPGVPAEPLFEDALATATILAGWGALGMETMSGWNLPTWSATAPEGRAGGRVDLVWSGSFDRVSGRVDVRLRALEWGPTRAWWREQATLEGRGIVPLPLGRLTTLTAELYGRTALRSERAGLVHPGGLETTVAVGGPMAAWAFGLPVWAEARLEDVFDRGLVVRPGAPRRGRRLTILVAMMGG